MNGQHEASSRDGGSDVLRCGRVMRAAVEAAGDERVYRLCRSREGEGGGARGACGGGDVEWLGKLPAFELGVLLGVCDECGCLEIAACGGGGGT